MTSTSPSVSQRRGLPPPLVAALALVAAFFFVIQGAQALYPPASQSVGWLWLLLATAAAALAFVLSSRIDAETLPTAQPAAFQSWRSIGVGVSLILLGLALVIMTVATLARTDAHQTMRYVWLGSLTLLVLGAAWVGALGPGVPKPWRAEPAARRLVWLELAGVAVLLGLAIFLRVYRLQQMPPGIFVDETNAALDALRIAEGRPDSPFATGWFETPNLYAFYLLGLFKLLGVTFAALKAASLLPAILTVLALYPLARLMFGVPTAFAATFLLAVSRWHITMSRWGWNEVAPLLFMILALFFVQRAVRDRRARDFAWSGVFLGLGHYTYLASRLTVLTVALYLIYRLLFERGFARRAWRGLVLLTLVYLATFGPLLVTYVRNPFTFNNRSQQVSILVDMRAAYAQGQPPPPAAVSRALSSVGLPVDISLQPLQQSVQRHLEMFFVAGDRNPRHNLPGEPMVDPVTGSLLALTLGFAAVGALRPNVYRHVLGAGGPAINAAVDDAARWAGGGQRYALLWLWLLIPLLGGILTRLEEAPQGYRTLPVIAAVALLAGNAAVRSARLFGAALAHLGDARDGRALRALPAVLMAGLLVWAGVLNARLFFNVQAKDGRVWQAFSPVETTVATEVAAAMDDHSLYLSPRLYHFSPLKYLAYRSPEQGGGGLDRPAYHLIEPATDLPLTDPFGQDALFLLDTSYQDETQQILSYYPRAQLEMVEGPGGQPLYLVVSVPGADIQAVQGLNAVYTLVDAGQAREVYRMAPRFVWPASLATQAPITATATVTATAALTSAHSLATWSGSLSIPASGLYDFVLDGPGRLILDDRVWQHGEPQFLGKGLHALRIEQTGGDAEAVLLLSWQPPGKAEFEPTPPNYFFTVAPPDHGLRGEYFLGELWEGQPAFTRIDPLLLFAWPEAEPWPAPFSVRWTGSITVPVTGPYRFQVSADDGVRLWMDGALVGESVVPDNVNQIDTQMTLDAGPHAIRIDYFQRGGGKALELWWQPPDGSLRPVPSAALSPDGGVRSEE